MRILNRASTQPPFEEGEVVRWYCDPQIKFSVFRVYYAVPQQVTRQEADASVARWVADVVPYPFTSPVYIAYSTEFFRRIQHENT